MSSATQPGTGRIVLATACAMLAFAGNSLLCRLALRGGTIDPASFTAIRLASGALVLALVLRLRAGEPMRGHWLSGLALFVYAAAFSWAYLALSAGTGALLLFGAVQATMLGWGLARGDRLRGGQWAGLLIAMAGLVGLLLPGLSAPSPVHAALMLAAGVAWGVYSLRARGAGDPTAATAGNFVRSVPWGLAMLAAAWPQAHAAGDGVVLAVLSGALASGLGYAVWYTALRGLRPASAASVQLSVPVIAALGGVLLLGEPLGWRLALCSVAVLGGIAAVIALARPGRP